MLAALDVPTQNTLTPGAPRNSRRPKLQSIASGRGFNASGFFSNNAGPGNQSAKIRLAVADSSSDDDTAVQQTLEQMARIIQRSACHPVVQSAAAAIAAQLPPGSTRAQIAEAVWAYVRSRVSFVPDARIIPGAREVLIEPPLLLSMIRPAGDCDDFTMSVAAILSALGVPVRPMAIAANPAEPEMFSHVYATAVLEDSTPLPIVFPVDASHGPYAGWEAPVHFRKLPWRTVRGAVCAQPEPQQPNPLWGLLGVAAVAGAVFFFWLGTRN